MQEELISIHIDHLPSRLDHLRVASTTCVVNVRRGWSGRVCHSMTVSLSGAGYITICTDGGEGGGVPTLIANR